MVNDQLDNGFRFRARDKNSRPDREIQVPEVRHPGDVLQGDALCPLGDEFGVAFRRRGVPQHHCPEPAEANAEQMIREQLSVDAGTRDAGVPEDRRGLADGSGQ
jgi:hypothetical protein